MMMNRKTMCVTKMTSRKTLTMCVDRQAGDDRGLDDKTHFDDDGENTSYIAFIMLVQYFLVFNLYKYILYIIQQSF